MLVIKREGLLERIRQIFDGVVASYFDASPSFWTVARFVEGQGYGLFQFLGGVPKIKKISESPQFKYRRCDHGQSQCKIFEELQRKTMKFLLVKTVVGHKSHVKGSRIPCQLSIGLPGYCVGIWKRQRFVRPHGHE